MSSNDDAEAAHRAPESARLITVEPTVIVTMFIIILSNILSKQYIHQRIASDHNFSLNRTTNQSCSDVKDNTSDPYYLLEQKVSSETAAWALYLNVANGIPALFSTVLLGSWGDKVGRKYPILLSLFGLVAFVSNFLIVMIFDLSLHFLFVGFIFCGLLGDFGNIISCSLSYLSDITTPAERTLRIALLETGLGVGGFVASMTSGLWDLEKGFQNPYWCMLGLSIFNFVYSLIFLRSTIERKVPGIFRHLFSKEPFVHMYQVMRSRQNGRHLTLILFTLCFCILIATESGVKGLLVIYVIGVPFCWNSLLIGIFSGLGQVSSFVSLITLKIFSKFSSQPILLSFGIVTSIASSALFAFCQTTWMLFLGQALQVFLSLPSPIIRSQASRIVSPDEVGSVFGVLGCSMVIGNTGGSLLYQGIFVVTADTIFPGAAFMVAAIILLLILPLYWSGYNRSELKQMPETTQYDAVSGEE